MNKLLRRKTLFLVLLAAFLCAPAAYAQGYGRLFTAAQTALQFRAESQQHVQAEPFARTQLYFGTAKPDGSMVTEEQWQRFLDQEITPRFPEGLTVLTGSGQFRDASGTIIRERTKVLILLYPIQTRARSSVRIEQIREAYKTAFQQQSVLRVDDVLPVWASF